jgi:hypothetical protein
MSSACDVEQSRANGSAISCCIDAPMDKCSTDGEACGGVARRKPSPPICWRSSHPSVRIHREFPSLPRDFNMPSSSTPRAEWQIGMRAQGWLRLGAWLVLLYAVHFPWDSLGGIVSERLRWMERFAIAGLFQVGCVIGSFADEARHRGQAATFWLALVTPLVVAMLALAVFEFRAEPYRGLVVFNGVLSLCAGFDVRRAAWQRMHGRPPLASILESRPIRQRSRSPLDRPTADRRGR